MINVRTLKLCGELICQFNCWIFPYFCQNYQKLRFKWLATNSSLIGTISEAFFKLTKFPVAIVSGGEDKAFFAYQLITWSIGPVTRLVRYSHPKSKRSTEEQQEQQNSTTKIYVYYRLGQACVTNWGSFVLLQIRATVMTK